MDIPQKRLAEAVGNSSFAAMSAHEARTACSGAPATSGERVMRRGQVGEWREWMTPRLRAYFTGQEARRVAAYYGYDLAQQ